MQAPVPPDAPPVTSAEFVQALEWATGEDERHFARTNDGWRIGLYRYLPEGDPEAFPLICGHGLAGSRLIFDPHPDYSLARSLASRGFDTWLVDLRGRNDSWPPGREESPRLQWTFDDFVFRDIPAAVEKICEETGTDGAFWLGTEMSGLALYAAVLSETVPQLRGGITMGSPVITPPSGEVPGVTTAYPKPDEGRYRFSIVREIGPQLAASRSDVLETSFRPSDTHWLVTARYFAHGVPDEASSLLDQFQDWMDSQTMRSVDGSVLWSNRLGEFTLPVLVMAGAADRQRPPEAARETFERLGSTDKQWVLAGTEMGFPIDVGHDDLVAGLCSPRLVYPPLAAWLRVRMRRAAEASS
jgi:pimeloyl-ACP methyl ester carboxylesterase